MKKKLGCLIGFVLFSLSIILFYKYFFPFTNINLAIDNLSPKDIKEISILCNDRCILTLPTLHSNESICVKFDLPKDFDEGRIDIAYKVDDEENIETILGYCENASYKKIELTYDEYHHIQIK